MLFELLLQSVIGSFPDAMGRRLPRALSPALQWRLGLPGRSLLTGLLLPRVFALLAAFLAFSFLVSPYSAQAACTVPNQITNGQNTDATTVMGDFTALQNCVDSVASSVVTPSGAPTTGSLPVFSGPKSVSSGNLSGDCVTSGSLTVTCTKASGIPLGAFATGTNASQLTGTISVNRLANGLYADNTTFLRGDGFWAVPPGTGVVASSTPNIRASNIVSFYANSVAVSWPPGTVAGDLVVIFVSSGFAVNNPPGWATLNNSGWNDWANGLTAAKIMTAADIAAGSATITTLDVAYGVAAAATVDGTTFNQVRETTGYRPPGRNSFSTAQVSGLTTAVQTDLIIGFTYVRGAMNPTISNFTQFQTLAANTASGFLGKSTAVLGKLGLAETATYPVANDGYYYSVVALR